MNKFTIVTPLFNRVDLTSQFVQGVAPFINAHGGELILVDNASTDNTLATLAGVKKIYKETNIKILSLPKNTGFGGGNNRGAQLSESDYLFFISNDVKILGDFVLPVLNYFENDKNTAIGPTVYTHDTGWNTFLESGIIPYIAGHFVAMPKRLWSMVGGWDEKIFIDYEDLELSYRLHLAGVGLMQMTLPVLHDHPGSSFGSLPQERIRYTFESQKYFMEKWNLTK